MKDKINALRELLDSFTEEEQERIYDILQLILDLALPLVPQ